MISQLEIDNIYSELEGTHLADGLHAIKLAQEQAMCDLNCTGTFDNLYPVGSLDHMAYAAIEDRHQPYYIPATCEIN